MRDDALLLHIRDAADAVRRYASRGRVAFLKSQMRQDAIIRQLAIIGEATKKLSAGTRDRAPGIPWKDIAGMREILIHDYFGVSLDEVWNTVVKDIPVLRRGVEALLDEEGLDQAA